MSVVIAKYNDSQATCGKVYCWLELTSGKNELILMFEQAGFEVEAVQGGYTEIEATADDGIIVFIARK